MRCVHCAGISVSSLTPPPHTCDADEKDAQERLIFQMNPLFTDEDMQGNSASPIDLQMNSDTDLCREPSMATSFVPLLGSTQCQHDTSQVSSPVLQGDVPSAAQGAVGKCSVSVQTSPVDVPTLTDTSDTSPESYTGAVSNLV